MQTIISIGVGLKTFVCFSNNGNEKVAIRIHFQVLADFQGKDLAHMLAEFRNERIDLANRLYNIESSLYPYCCKEKKANWYCFETRLRQIDIKNIFTL